jgi:hypothetical protein
LLSSNVSNLLGDGNIIAFWKEKWLGMLPLMGLFPSLYVKVANQEASVKNMGWWKDDRWRWKLDWSEPLTSDEIVEADELDTLHILS